MKIRKLGWLAVFVALAAAFGTVGMRSQTAHAQVPPASWNMIQTICNPLVGNATTFTCTQTLTVNLATTTPETVTVSIGQFTNLGFTDYNARLTAVSRTGGTASCAVGTQLVSGTVYQFSTTGPCASGQTVIHTLTLTPTGPNGSTTTSPIGGGPLCFSTTGSANVGGPPFAAPPPPSATPDPNQGCAVYPDGFTRFVIPGLAGGVVGVNACVQPIGLAFAFPASSNSLVTLPAGLPSPIGGSTLLSGLGTPAAVGVLPAALVGQVLPLTAPGVTGAVCAGQIQVTSINGTLITASGTLTTTLTISCGDPIQTVFTGGTINPNTCTGVNFAVTGAGVGFVEIRARYEPGNLGLTGFPGFECDEFDDDFFGLFDLVPFRCIDDRTVATVVGFVAPRVGLQLRVDTPLSLNPSHLAAFNTGVAPNVTLFRSDPANGVGVATLTFESGNRICSGPGSVTVILCVDPNTGLPISTAAGSILNGTVTFVIDDPLIIAFAGQQPSVITGGAAAPNTTAGFTTLSNQLVTRCGAFSERSTTINADPAGRLFGTYFGGCDSVQATYIARNAGQTNITAIWNPDLPGAYAVPTGGINLASNLVPLIYGFNLGSNTGLSSDTRGVTVLPTAPSGNVSLARGCNNVSPTVSESTSAYAARVNPSGILISIWEHQAANNNFRGWSPQAGAPNDLNSVTRLTPVFVCTNGSGTLSQPAA